MRVHMQRDETVRVDKLNSKTYPADWKGEVDDTLAAKWIAAGAAVAIASEAQPAVLTDAETRALKAAAQAAIAQASAGEDGETVDPETGEVIDGDEDGETGEQSTAEVLASLTFDELKDLAKKHDVKFTARKRGAIEADLVAKLEASAAAAAEVSA